MPVSRNRQRGVGLWLLVVAALVVVQVVLGGVTRLTDSGLSITEWRPLLGVVPPSDEAQWAAAFSKYQQIPQYQKLKSHLTVEEFKFIYFWEWLHRLWGRLLGVAFAVPLLVFWRRGRLGGLRARLVVLFVLGGLQGLLGWVMVASGLQDLVYVSHLRLTAHFMLALLLLGALVWVGFEQLDREAPPPAPRALDWATRGLLGALAIQLAVGALMAGLKAALFAPTWPTINGQWVPSWGDDHWWNEPLAIHFAHRGLAYLVLAAVGGWWWASRAVLKWARHAVLGLAVAQVVLGIVVVVRAPFSGDLVRYGVLHQLVGVLLFSSLVVAVAQVRAAARRHGP